MRARTLRDRGRRGRSASRLLATAAVALASLAVAAPAPGSPAPVSDVCDGVRELVDAALPQAATELVTAVRSGAQSPAETSSGTTTTLGEDGTTTAVEEGQSPAQACALEEGLASAAVSRAQVLAEEAAELVPTDAQGAQDKAAEALGVDAQNETALQAKADADAALAQPVGEAAESWDSFVDQFVEPLEKPALAAALVLVLLLVLARSLAGVTLYWPRLPRHARLTAAVAGGVALVLASLTLTTAFATDVVDAGRATCRVSGPCTAAVGTWAVASVAVAVATLLVVAYARHDPRDDVWTWWRWLLIGAAASTFFLGVVVATLVRRALQETGPPPPDVVPFAGAAAVSGTLLALLGVGLVALVVATRLRVSVQVTDATGQSEAGRARVVAFLRELGAEKPRGLETPAGADVDALNSSVLGGITSGKVVTAVADVLRAVLGAAPWRVHVAANDGDRLSVMVTRNGRAAGSAIVDRHVLLRVAPEESAKLLEKIDLYRGAAAVVVMTLSRHHDGFDGLCGTTSWRGLALHYVATTDLRTDSARRPVLAAAAELDPSSDLVQFALMHASLRESQDLAELTSYVKWLTTFAKSHEDPHQRHRASPGYTALRLRALYVRAAMEINRSYAAGEEIHPGSALNTYLSELQDGLAAAAHDAPDDHDASTTGAQESAAVREIRYATESLVPYMLSRGTVERQTEQDEPADPRSPSARYNRACYLATVGEEPEEAVRELRLAGADPENTRWMREDPQLRTFRRTAAYRREFGDPAAGFLDLRALARVRDGLRRTGLVEADLLPRSVAAIVRTTGLPVATAVRLRRVASVVESVPAPLAPVRHDVADVLAEGGYLRRRDVPRRDSAEGKLLADELRERLYRLKAPDGNTLTDYFATLHTWLALDVTPEQSAEHGPTTVSPPAPTAR